jgi:hypothetical protein
MHLITVFLCNALFLLVIRYYLSCDHSEKAYFCQLLESNFVFETYFRSVGRMNYVFVSLSVILSLT